VTLRGHDALPREQPFPEDEWMRVRARITAWSVSSVTRPAGKPALMSLLVGPSSNPISVPNSSTTCVRGRNWVGMPNASPMASP
jgi:hypothetical protein